MKSGSPRLPLLSLLLLAAGCAAPGDIESAPEAEIAAPRSGAHLLPLPGARARRAEAKAGAYNFTYHGGQVISHVEVFTIFWGPRVQDRRYINGFYQAITQSPHLDWLSEYKTPTQTIGRGSFVGSYVDPSPPSSASLGDKDIQAELTRLIQGGAVPAPGPDSLYMIHFPEGVSIEMDGNLSCQQFCAYHGSFKIGEARVYYGVMPDFSGGCQSCGGGEDKRQSTTIVAAHELIEAITDPGVGLANANDDASQLAWYDDQNGEVGDVCQNESGLVAGFAVQGEYSMLEGACIVVRSPGVGDDGAACDHGVCAEGGPLRSSCGACTARVCEADAACCSARWDSSCVQRSVDLCRKRCP